MAYSKNGVYGAGEQPQKGDIVRCVSTAYCGIRQGDKRVVLDVGDGCVILWNEQSPHNKKSPYKASNFELISRKAPYQQLVAQGEKKVANYLHVAYRAYDGFSWDELAREIRDQAAMTMSSTSLDKLKAEITTRIEQYPDESWVIVGGMGVASGKRRPAVDVSFRSL